MTLTTAGPFPARSPSVSDACQINDFDHRVALRRKQLQVSDACQINDFDHAPMIKIHCVGVSDACQINDFDHSFFLQSAVFRFQMPVRSMTLTTQEDHVEGDLAFQMPVRSMTLTTVTVWNKPEYMFQMPVRSMTLTTRRRADMGRPFVSDACQINDFDHVFSTRILNNIVSDACQINDFDHCHYRVPA